MQSVQQSDHFFAHLFVPLASCGAKAAARGAGIIDSVPLLCAALWIDAKADAFSCGLRPLPKLGQLARRVEHNMVSVTQKLSKILFSIGTAEHMAFSGRHFLCPESRFKQAAGFGACEVFLQ